MDYFPPCNLFPAYDMLQDYRYSVTISMENVLSRYIPKCHQFKPSTLNTGGGCHSQSLHIPLVRGKFISCNVSRVAALWNRFLSEFSHDNYNHNLFKSGVNGYLFYACSKSTISTSIKQPNSVNL